MWMISTKQNAVELHKHNEKFLNDWNLEVALTLLISFEGLLRTVPLTCMTDSRGRFSTNLWVILS